MDPLTCDAAHELLSARLDGELTAAEHDHLEMHTESCTACISYAAQLQGLHGRLRVRPALMAPDLAPLVLARARPAALRSNLWVRLSLVWVALVLGVPSAIAVIAGEADGAESHTARHLGSFGVALAVGFIYAAWKPRRASGLLPFTAVLVVLTVITAVVDLAQGQQTALPETSHLAEIIGLALLWTLSGMPGWRPSATQRLTHRSHS